MATNTVYLITGANRGIGLGLAGALLQRPNTTVIATVRSTSTSVTNLNGLLKAKNSQLHTLILDAESDTGAQEMVASLPNGVTHIDTIIANAGGGETFQSTLATPLSQLRLSFEVNTLGPIRLYQATYSLLTASRDPKFVFISSSLGSIGDMENNVPCVAYGVSKAAANYFVRKVHFEEEKITALAVHPGWVRTANGQNFADAVGVEMPPMGLEECVRGLLAQIDGASRNTTSGQFVSYDGSVILW